MQHPGRFLDLPVTGQSAFHLRATCAARTHGLFFLYFLRRPARLGLPTVDVSLRDTNRSRHGVLGLLSLAARLTWVVVAFATSAFAQDEPPAVKLSVVRATAGGVHVYAPNRWGLLHVNLTNTQETPRDLLTATYFDGAPTLQFGQRLRLPAKSLLRTVQPVLIPPMNPDHGRALNFQTLVLDAGHSDGAGAADEVLLRDEAGLLRHDGAILVTHNPRITGLINESPPGQEHLDHEVADLVAACRVSQDLGRQIALPSGEQLAHEEFSLHALDHLVLAGNHLVDDAAALASIRRWLFGGGHLWVMLDRTDPRLLEMLVGDRFNGHVVDRVGLNSVQIFEVQPTGTKSMGEPVEYETPVDLVRVVVQDVEIEHEVNDWPAAFWVPCGDGRLLVTTLGARGWMVSRSDEAKSVPRRSIASQTNAEVLKADSEETAFRTNRAMSLLASDFFLAGRPEELVSTAALETQVGEYIGYSVPSRGVVLGSLAVLVMLMLSIGTWLYARSAVEHMGWIGPLLAILFGAALLQLGRSNRHAITDAVAAMQFVQPIPGTDDVSRRGVVATYFREGSQQPIRATAGGRLMPDMTGLDGTVRRMVWTDIESWQWENVPQAAGQHSAAFQVSASVVPRIEARATFDSAGLVGRVTGVSQLEDGVLATRMGRMGVEFQDDGSFVVRTENVFGREQFLAADMLADEQDRRRRTLEKLLTNKLRRDYPEQPTLLAWNDRPNANFQFGEGLQSRGSTLMAIPLVLERPQIGREIAIPSPWLPYRNTLAPDGAQPSAMWNNQLKEWQERAAPSSAWLRFQVPRELLPLKATRARIVIQVTGPVGRLELLGQRDGAAHSIQTLIDPVGLLTLEITDPALLTVASDGSLVLGINAGDRDQAEFALEKQDAGAKVNYWRIESLGLQLWATPTEPPTKE